MSYTDIHYPVSCFSVCSQKLFIVRNAEINPAGGSLGAGPGGGGEPSQRGGEGSNSGDQ